MEHRHGQNKSAKEPVRDVDVADLALRQRSKKHDGVGHPNDGNQQIDRPFEFGILLALGVAKRKRNCRCNDDGLPPQKSEHGERWRKQARVAGTLHAVKTRRKE